MKKVLGNLFFLITDDEKAQAMTEYILVAVVLMITASVSFNALGRLLYSYFQTLAIYVALPVP